MKQTFVSFAVLFAMGLGWGLTTPLAVIATSTGHQPYGLIFWQMVIVTAIMAPIALLRGRLPRLGWSHLRLFTVVALTGAILPDVFFYISAAQLPGGILSVILCTAPMFSLPIALAMGNDRFSWLRLTGLALGLVGVVLMIGPDTALPDPAMTPFVLLALIAACLYATEGNIVAKWGTHGLDPIQTALGTFVMGLIFALPLALGTGQWINPADSFGVPELAFTLGAALHGMVYVTYVWLVGRAGSVFAAQSAYIVMATGLVASMLWFGERYSPFVWVALGLMSLGIFLVQPRRSVRLSTQ